MRVLISVFMLVSLSFGVLANNKGKKDDQGKVDSSFYKRKYYTIKLQGSKPSIDGRLDDACWKEGEWSADYVQHAPVEGGKASQRTVMKVLYDDKNIYVAFRCYDNEPSKIQRYTSRRDEFAGEIVGINFDSYFDHRFGYEFNITAGGTKIDLLLKNDGVPDFNWNAVWYGETAMEDSAWTAEMQIPLSQLRYNGKEEQIWGMHSWRWIARLQEEDQWSLIPRKNTGFIYNFGELHGIKNLTKSHRVELFPYVVGKVYKNHKDGNNPFTGKVKNDQSAGLDAKIGVGSDFTLDMTFNPDFGQVEADPSVMNLSGFETYYQEKRPFFLEGKNVFDFDFDGDLVFHSRRIGHKPSYSPDVDDDTKQFIQVQDNTTIIDALKFSGKTANGLSIGVLQSLSSEEYSDLSGFGDKKRVIAEPYTNYTLVRVQKDYNAGNTIIGGIGTATNRFLNSDSLKGLNKAAYTSGIDFQQYFLKRNYNISVKAVYSRVQGDKTAISDLQESLVHNFQRPDVSHLTLDKNLTSLEGNGGSVAINKSGNSRFQFTERYIWRSPGFDMNDMGFQRIADFMRQQLILQYKVMEPGKLFREWFLYSETNNDWDYGGLNTDNNMLLNFNVFLHNKWFLANWFYYSFGGYDTRTLQGGPALRFDPIWHNGFEIGSDGSKKVVGRIHFSQTIFLDGKSVQRKYVPELGFRIGSRFTLNTELEYLTNMFDLQYVKHVENPDRYIVAKIDQKTLTLTFRLDINITKNFSVQYYGSPFYSTGKYSDFKRITIPRADKYNERFRALKDGDEIVLDNKNNYNVNESGMSYSFENPDFTKREFHSNFVARWEYKEGSVLYVVWAHQRSIKDSEYYPGLTNNFGKIADTPSDNIFMVKLNYYFSL